MPLEVDQVLPSYSQFLSYGLSILKIGEGRIEAENQEKAWRHVRLSSLYTWSVAFGPTTALLYTRMPISSK